MKVTNINTNTKGQVNRSSRVLAITGGKGGVGKTSLSINLAIALAKTGSKVCLFDADTGLANVNVMLGLHPAYTLEHLFTGEKSIQDVVLEGPEGIHIVPGASGFAQCVELEVPQQKKLVESISALEPNYDYMLVDTAAGISPTVLHFVAACQVAAVVITPEPTSLTDAFSLLKVLRRRGYRRRVEIIVNMAANATQADKVYRRFQAAVKKYLDLNTDYLGAVWMDESMRSAVSLQRPVALFSKDDPSAKSFYRLAEKIDDVFSRPATPKLSFSAYWRKLVERSIATTEKREEEQRQANLVEIERQIAERLKEHAASVSSRSDSLISSPDVSRPDVPGRKSVKPATVVDLNGKSYQESLSQVQRQVKEQKERDAQAPQPEVLEPEATPLSADSENSWVDLRIRMNKFFTSRDTTPEQVTTLISSCIYAYGDRLGEAAIDLLHGLLSTLNPEDVNAEHKLLLLAEYERLGIVPAQTMESRLPITQTDIDDEVIEVQSKQVNVTDEHSIKARYDEGGFGSQSNLVEQIRSAPPAVPLESLLESIKYAALVDSNRD
jgi:MinD-like ATPase involved in chromosome partitioning or flagellar assembly/NACalpha-BTF3-like transcription factor